MGAHNITVSDNAGNETTVDFEIKAAPSVDLGGDFIENEDGESITTEDVVIAPSGENLTIKVNGRVVPNPTTLTESGSYIVEISDTFGNIITKEFTIDKSVPSVPVISYDEGYTNTSVTVTIDYSDETTIGPE